MYKTNCFLLLTGILLTLILAGVSEAFSGAGSGTEAAPYIITNVIQLQEMKNELDKWYELGNDIDASETSTWNSGAGFEPIGNPSAIYFLGHFDGKGHKITNLKINRTTNYIGLFGISNPPSTIKNVGLEDANITGNWTVGGLVGQNGNVIDNSYVKSTIAITGNKIVGGLVGINTSIITNSYAEINVTNSGIYTGGLVGYNTQNITNCYSKGNVQGVNRVGGLVGYNTGYVGVSYSTGSVSGSSDEIGGLIGFNGVTTQINNAYATGAVSGAKNVGGLVGRNESIVIDSYSTGSVTGATNVGGLAGLSTPTCYDSFWDTQTSEQPTSACGTGKTTTEMQDVNTFLNAGWDFNTPVWKICNGTNYPKLEWQESLTGDFACPDGVDIYDLAIFIDQWLLQGGYIADIAPAPGGDGIVNMLDFAVFAENWLAGQ
jgi:hypothetical protein